MWSILRIYHILAFIALSLDPDFAWGPVTKQILIYFYIPFRGYYISEGESINVLIVMQSLVFTFVFSTFLILWFVLRNEYAKGRALIFLQMMLMFMTHIIPIPLATMMIEPWKCDFKTGRMIKFPEQSCFGVPNVIFFVLSFISFSILFLEFGIRTYL